MHRSSGMLAAVQLFNRSLNEEDVRNIYYDTMPLAVDCTFCSRLLHNFEFVLLIASVCSLLSVRPHVAVYSSSESISTHAQTDAQTLTEQHAATTGKAEDQSDSALMSDKETTDTLIATVSEGGAAPPAATHKQPTDEQRQHSMRMGTRTIYGPDLDPDWQTESALAELLLFAEAGEPEAAFAAGVMLLVRFFIIHYWGLFCVVI